MNAVFCHGVLPPDLDWNKNTYSPTKGWKEWLQFVLEQEHDIVMQIPRFPHAHTFMMKYSEWEEIMDSQKIDSDTILIGHSAGAGFILKYMALHPELKVKQILLVAPWIDTGGANPFGFYKHNLDQLFYLNCMIILFLQYFHQKFSLQYHIYLSYFYDSFWIFFAFY